MKGILLLLLTCFIWALDTLIRYPLMQSGVSAISIVFYEHLFLALILGLFFRGEFRSFWSASVSQIFSFIFVGAGGSALGTLCFTKAFYYLDPSVAILLQKLQPLIAIFFASLILGENVTNKFLVLVILSFVGVILVTSGNFADALSHLTHLDLTSTTSWIGYGLAIAAALFWGVSTVFGKKLLSEGFNEKQLLLGRYFFALMALTPFVAKEPILLHVEGLVLLKILIMALVTGVLSMYLYYMALKSLEAKLTALGELFFPFMAVLVNMLFLNSILTPMQMIGGALILFSAFIIKWRKY